MTKNTIISNRTYNNIIVGENMENFKLGVRTSWITVGINFILGAFKLFVGIVGHSYAMIADSLHTLSDVFTTFLVLIGLNISTKEAKNEHSIYKGYVSAFEKLLGIILILMGSYLIYNCIELLIFGEINQPGLIALFAALLSIIVKELMYWYTINISRKIKSLSMEADAWHHREDAFSSIGTFLAIISSRLGLVPLDAIAGIVVSIVVIKVGIKLYNKSNDRSIEKIDTDEITNDLETIIYETQGVQGIKSLKSRLFNDRVYIDLEIFVDPNISVKEGHDIARSLQYRIENELKNIKHSMVHIVPNNK